MIMDKVVVLMSTYNGARYLREQVNSVLSQKDVKVQLIVRDDGSTDETISILDEFIRCADNIRYIKGGNIGPCSSFLELLKISDTAEYYAFCDQDDVWEEEKLKTAINRLKTFPTQRPALYCSNLKVVDENLNYCFLCHKKAFDVSNRYLALVEFPGVGCTEVFNKAARDFVVNNPVGNCLMHDSLLFLICNFMGNVFWDYDSHILYRQHSNNVIGTSTNKLEKLKGMVRRFNNHKYQPRLENARMLINNYSAFLEKDDFLKINAVACYKDSIINRIKLLFNYKIRSCFFLSDIRYRIKILYGII